MLSTRRRRLHLTAISASLCLAALAGCGSDDDEAATTEAASATPTAAETTAAQTTAAETTAAPTTAAVTTAAETSAAETTAGSSAEAETVEVEASDYKYAGLPASISAGSLISLTNTSDVELHEFVAVKIPDDESRSAEELLLLPEEELNTMFAGEPAAVIIAPPGETGFPVVGDGTIGEAGRYLVICAIPVGADPQEYMEAAATAEEGPPQVEGGPPHFTVGMFGEFTVG